MTKPTNFKDLIHHLNGVPIAPLGMFAGRHIFVDPVSGLDGAGQDGTYIHPVKTLARALALATANQNDVVWFVGRGNAASLCTDYQSTALDWNKDGVHLVGVNAGGILSQRARIAQLSTVKTLENLFTVSADNCFIANIQVFQGVALSTAVAPESVIVSGQRNHFYNCHFAGNGDTAGSMDLANTRSLSLNGGDENLFTHCTIGLDTVSCATMDSQVNFRNGATRNIFEDCLFLTMAGASGHTFLNLSVSGCIDRFVHLKNCTFVNPIHSTATSMTEAVDTHASQGGSILIDNTTLYGVGAAGWDAGSLGTVLNATPVAGSNGDGGFGDPVD